MDMHGLRPIWAERLRLTNREMDVLEHIIQGRTTKETAIELGISPSTVEVHRERLRLKVGARNTADLMRKALLEN